jgi:hypothetical protein
MRTSTRINAYLSAAVILLSLQACSRSFSHKDTIVTDPTKLSSRLQKLFAKTKLVCFGRYALEVPQEAELIIGRISIPDDVEVINGGAQAIKSRVAIDIAKLKQNDRTAEVTYDREGPIEGSWQLRYYESQAAKEFDLHFFTTYVNKGDFAFIIGDSLNGGTEEAAAARQAALAKSIRLRSADEVPNDPGFCIQHGFITDDLYGRQEVVNAGIYLPSLPDITFSISSNKDAYGDYSPAEFEKTQRAKLSLLARIRKAQEDQGIHYPSRTVFREGKREVNHWRGEESLIKRKDGTHDFEWALVGTPKNVANPSEFNVQMYTKVEHNTVGAAKTASLSDDEAVALWDKLLFGLKFRVKVPGAPEGSYFLPPSQTGTATASR